MNMKVYNKKIKPVFIKSIINKIKKHEYRLCDEENSNVKKGDILNLISNIDKDYYVTVKIKSIKHFSNWESALKETWEDDFKGIFDNFVTCLKECKKFYSYEDVNKYGIVVWEIEPKTINLIGSRILLDTNIIIQRESYNNVSFEVNQLYNLIDKFKNIKYISKYTKEELLNYKDSDRSEKMQLKLNSYEVLPNFKFDEDEFFINVVSKYKINSNSEIDNKLLLDIYQSNADILVTNDKQMLQKAENLYIRDYVLTPNELLAKFEEISPKNINYNVLSIRLKKFSEININDPFFDSLKEDYDFEEWFKKKGNEEAYVIEENNVIKGFLYLKQEFENEDYSNIYPKFAPLKRLKIGTFKSILNNMKISERFLKIVFEQAINKNVDEIYITMKIKKDNDLDKLKSILLKWGFFEWGKKNDDEVVLVKKMNSYDNEKSSIHNFPNIKHDPDYYFLPIKSEYHTELFPDLILKNEDIKMYKENKSHRFALEKIYVSNKPFLPDIKEGDLIFIYRIGDRLPKKYTSVVTGIAIYNGVKKYRNFDEFKDICESRTVFSSEKIRELYESKPKLISLLDYKKIDKKIILEKLREEHIIAENEGPRQFDKIDKKHVKILFEIGGLKYD